MAEFSHSEISLTDGSSSCNGKKEVVRLSGAAKWMWSPRHRLSSGVEGLGSRWRHFLWRWQNFGDERHGWQSWVISLRVTAWSHFHNSSLPTMSGHDVNTASSSASVASSRTSTATVDKTNCCFLELLLLSAWSQYWGSVQKQLETANRVYFPYFQEKRRLWRCFYPWLTCPSVASETPPKRLWFRQLSLRCHHKPWRLCACCSTV